MRNLIVSPVTKWNGVLLTFLQIVLNDPNVQHQTVEFPAFNVNVSCRVVLKWDLFEGTTHFGVPNN